MKSGIKFTKKSSHLQLCKLSANQQSLHIFYTRSTLKVQNSSYSSQITEKKIRVTISLLKAHTNYLQLQIPHSQTNLIRGKQRDACFESGLGGSSKTQFFYLKQSYKLQPICNCFPSKSYQYGAQSTLLHIVEYEISKVNMYYTKSLH